MPHRCRIQKQRFACGHRGLGRYCHCCALRQTQQPKHRTKRQSRMSQAGKPSVQATGDRLDLNRLPTPIQAKAKQVLAALAAGVPYWKLGGKRLKRLEGAVRIPVTYRYRLLGRLEAGRVVPVRVLSHEDYNPLVRSQRRLKQVLGGQFRGGLGLP